ncbi:MAG: M4 family metallopeptidase [Legionella sp.]
MLKKTLLLLGFAPCSLLASQSIELHDAPLSSIQHLMTEPLDSRSVLSLQTARKAPAATQQHSSLAHVARSQAGRKTLVRYQQVYRGIPVIGAQVISQQSEGAQAKVNGYLVEQIQINTQPALSSARAINTARADFFKNRPAETLSETQAQLQLRMLAEDKLTLVFLVSFKTLDEQGKPQWPFFIIDAQDGRIVTQWDNVKNHADSGPGGNEKTHEYWYGQDGLPALEVRQEGSQCTMDNGVVRLIHLESKWDWNRLLTTAFSYPCGSNQEEYINGAYSPVNDAYYFGQVIVDMYKDWYGLNALEHSDGSPMPLLMRVHFGQSYDNAFWDGEAMSFGDGDEFYPLVSLDVAGHEVTHGFTQQHANLEYHDQSGALNESLSDMAGQASRAYLLEREPALYRAIYFNQTEITWGIGETIVRDSFGKALRFMDFPSSDGSSADCLDKAMAQATGTFCAISYDEVVAYADSHLAPHQRQSFIVHTASGVFNKAFYLLAQQLGIKKTYQLMVNANMNYWTPTTDFTQGACGVLYAADDASQDRASIISVFKQVGVDTSSCKI